jgi:2-dehydro-3-deoxy-D-arabinonate dehydratase
MKLGQIKWNNNTTAAIFEADGTARPIPDYDVYDLVRLADMERNPLSKVANRLASTHKESVQPLIPIQPREVWACGCTYKQSSDFRDAEHGTREGFYAYVYSEPRPEIFFKGTSRVCVGPNAPIGLRSDAKFTAPEPELGLVLGAAWTHPRLRLGQRCICVGHRTRESAVPAAVEGVHRLLFPRTGDRHRRRARRSV